MFTKQKIPYLHPISRVTPRFLRAMTLFTLVAFSSMISISASAENKSSDADKKFKIVTTFTIIQDIAQNVAGDAAVVESITKPGAEIHDYQPTPRDIVKAQSADLILWNGMNLERWFERFFENIKDVPSAVVTDGITPCLSVKGPIKVFQTHTPGCHHQTL